MTDPNTYPRYEIPAGITVRKALDYPATPGLSPYVVAEVAREQDTQHTDPKHPPSLVTLLALEALWKP